MWVRTTGSGSFITGIVSGGGGFGLHGVIAQQGIIITANGRENQSIINLELLHNGVKVTMQQWSVYNPNPTSDPVVALWLTFSCEGQGWYFYGSSGNATGVGWVSSSDQRPRTNIKPITGCT